MIEQILMISLWCLGFNRVLDNWIWHHSGHEFGLDEMDQDLYKRKGFLARLVYFILKPVILCVVCYASVHGSIIYWTFYAGSEIFVYDLLKWVYICVCVAFVNALFSRLYSWLQ